MSSAPRGSLDCTTTEDRDPALAPVPGSPATSLQLFAGLRVRDEVGFGGAPLDAGSVHDDET